MVAITTDNKRLETKRSDDADNGLTRQHGNILFQLLGVFFQGKIIDSVTLRAQFMRQLKTLLRVSHKITDVDL